MTSVSFRLSLTVQLFCLTSIPAFAQLDRTALSDLKAEGERQGWTFTVGENSATQYSLDQLCGLREPADWKSDAVFKSMASAAATTLPSAFDWRTYDGCTPIRNQGGCGSCWAFATVGALECAIMIREGVSVNLSEQWLLSCNQSGWTCNGGWYAHSYHGGTPDHCNGTGAVLESDMPYQAREVACNCPYPHHYLIDSWAYIGNDGSVPGIEAMKRAILEYGPISVSIYANSAFQAYRSGVFNYSTSGDINHAVVLVGWDDSQGQSGVWILRNSWGSGWGESGYMRIEYGCCNVGYAACFVDYRPVRVTAQNDFGPSPLTVNFQLDVPNATVSGCTWEFGDGEISNELNPVHQYDQPGCFSIKLTVNTTGGNLVKVCPNLVSAYADSLQGPAVHLTGGGPVRLDIRARNFLTLNKLIIPFAWGGPFNLRYDSFSVAGARTAYFDNAAMLSYDINNHRAALVLEPGFQPPLAIGEGVVASLWFTSPAGVSGSNPIEFVSYGHYSPEFVSGGQAYQPSLTAGYFFTDVSVSCCSGVVGDVNQSGDDEPTIGDISMLVDNLFISGAALGCLEEADVNQSGGAAPTYADLTIGDISMLVDHLFISGQPLLKCL